MILFVNKCRAFPDEYVPTTEDRYAVNVVDQSGVRFKSLLDLRSEEL